MWNYYYYYYHHHHHYFLDGLTHWGSRDSDGGMSSAADVEMTSYVLLATLHGLDQSQATTVLPIVRWLSTQRNSYGGFSSTQVHTHPPTHTSTHAHAQTFICTTVVGRVRAAKGASPNGRVRRSAVSKVACEISANPLSFGRLEMGELVTWLVGVAAAAAG